MCDSPSDRALIRLVRCRISLGRISAIRAGSKYSRSLACGVNSWLQARCVWSQVAEFLEIFQYSSTRYFLRVVTVLVVVVTSTTVVPNSSSLVVVSVFRWEQVQFWFLSLYGGRVSGPAGGVGVSSCAGQGPGMWMVNMPSTLAGINFHVWQA